jgi:integrase/recombinase XerD
MVWDSDPHVLRHTFAVAAVQKGISPPALQRLLGHDRLTTTEIYLNLSPEDVMRELREKWEQAVFSRFVILVGS